TVALLALGLTWTVLIDAMTRRLGSRPAAVRWAVVLLAVFLAGGLQTLADFLLLRLAALTVLPDWRPWALDIELYRFTGAYLVTTCIVGFAAAVVWAGRSIVSVQEAATREADLRVAASRA